jgi:hypothetical protein
VKLALYKALYGLVCWISVPLFCQKLKKPDQMIRASDKFLSETSLFTLGSGIDKKFWFLGPNQTEPKFPRVLIEFEFVY